MVGDIYTYRQIRVYLPVHLAAIARIDSYSNSNGCGVAVKVRGNQKKTGIIIIGWVGANKFWCEGTF